MCWTDGFCQKWHSRVVHPLPVVDRHAREIDFPPPPPPTLWRTPRIIVTSICIGTCECECVCDIKRVLDFLTFEFLVNIEVFYGRDGAGIGHRKRKICLKPSGRVYIFYNSR